MEWVSFKIFRELGISTVVQCLGPGESYPDKYESQKMGVHESNIEGLSVNYDVPQENGNRMEARDVLLSGSKSEVGLEFCMTGRTFSWAVDRYSAAELESAKHPCDLKAGNSLTIRVDAAVAGVGSGACGPDVLEEHQVKFQDYEFECVLKARR